MKFLFILLLSGFTEPAWAQYFNECTPSFGNDTVFLDNGKLMVDSFYNSVLIRKRIFEEWGMSSEIYYDEEGLIKQSIVSYKNGFKEWVEYPDYNTGHRIQAGWYESGQMRFYREFSEDSFDAIYQFYYENGKLSTDGYYRKEKVQWLKSYTDTSFILRNDTFYDWYRETQVGLWHFYYPDGKDSAFGNYAYVAYEFDSLLPYSPGDLVIATLITSFSEIKTGTWNYYSPGGKLIYVEEWNQGNLLNRKEIH